ncbi:MAG: hypothetical protein GWN00_01030 [Aliifodinibius sp.]|nr:hypothetical protein [Fodinibius sp.]NIV09914.1 hypothetical protein [Fodinibius sp.]NIY23444.1 hypothetical protein [Fodinibius sp.]
MRIYVDVGFGGTSAEVTYMATARRDGKLKIRKKLGGGITGKAYIIKEAIAAYNQGKTQLISRGGKRYSLRVR